MSLAQNSPQGQADRLQAERERAYAAQMRFLADVAASLATDRAAHADLLAENDRLRAADAERQAMREGVRVSRARRSERGVMPPAGPQNVEQAARAPVSLADQLATTSQRITVKPSDFALGLSVYARISQALAARKLAHVDRLYSIFQHRARAQHGNAYATEGELVAYAATLGIGRSKIARALPDGRGLTWDALPSADGRERLYRLRSKEQVCAALGISWPGPRVDLPDRAYTGTLHVYLAHVYSAFWHGQDGRRYSRRTLQRLFGVTRRTLYALGDTSGVRALKSHVEADAPLTDFQTAELAQHRGRRWWYTVREGSRAICGAGVLDAENEIRPNYQTHVDHVRREATRKPGRTLKTAWQEANAYAPGCTRLSASGRSRHITRNLTTPDHGHKPRRFAGALGGSSCAEPPQHFRTLAEAAAWQARKPNRARVAAVLIGHRAPMTPHRPHRVQRVTDVYALQYSMAASFDLPALPEAQQARLLQRGAW